MQVILETERFFLRKMTMEDFDSLYVVLADSDSMCGGIYPDKTALCRHHLSGYSGREGFADWKREEFIMMENERIRIYPASQEQMEKFIASETDEERKKAYSEMREGCLANPGEWDWYAMWMIEKPDGTHIGRLSRVMTGRRYRY